MTTHDPKKPSSRLRRILVKMSSEQRLSSLEKRISASINKNTKFRRIRDRISLWHAEEEPTVDGNSVIWRSKYGPRSHVLRQAEPQRVPTRTWKGEDGLFSGLVLGLGDVPRCLRESFVLASLVDAQEALESSTLSFLVLGAALAASEEGGLIMGKARALGIASTVWLSERDDIGLATWEDLVRFASEWSFTSPELELLSRSGRYYALGPGLEEVLPCAAPTALELTVRGQGKMAEDVRVELLKAFPRDLRAHIWVCLGEELSKAELVELSVALLKGALIVCQVGALPTPDPLLEGLPFIEYSTTQQLQEELGKLTEIEVLKRAHHGARWARRKLGRMASLERLAFLVGAPSPAKVSPRVSVICVSNRPGLVSNILATFARFDYPNKELIMVLNVEHLSAAELEDARCRAPSARFLRTTSSMSLGESLNMARSVALGELWTKLDDDDHYSPNYLTDLVEALLLSGASVLGKGSFFTYLDRTRELYLREQAVANAPSERFVHGGTILARAADTKHIAFRPVVRGTDSLFLQDCRIAGLAIYSADCLNFAYVRYQRAGHHTFDVAEDEALQNSHYVGAGSLDLVDV